MENDMDENTREIVEELRNRYRKEAIKAVAEAEIRGFQRAKEKYEGKFEEAVQSAAKSVSDENTKTVVEELRIRYRKEAVKAVVEAENRGFEKAKEKYEGSLRSALEDAKVWQAIASAVGSVSQEPDPKLFIKYVMEHIYKGIKKEWAEEEETAECIDTITRIKVSL
jgi:hypothetical protein